MLILLMRKEAKNPSYIISCGASLVSKSVFLSQFYHLSLIPITIY